MAVACPMREAEKGGKQVPRQRTFTGVVELEDGWLGLGRVDEFPTPEEFVSAFNRHMMLDGDDQFVVEEVVRGWVRWVPGADGGYIKLADGPGHGAFEVWYIPEP